jgi:hypothetical protein
MLRRALVLVALSLVSLPMIGRAVASQPAARTAWSTSVARGPGQELLSVRSVGSARHYMLCVNPPRAGATCRRYALHALGGGRYGSTVHWGHEFPYTGPGRYDVSWKHSGAAVGTARTFHWSVCPPYGHVLGGVRNHRRLILIDRCRSIEGTISAAKHSGDGDFHITYRPRSGGRLVVEFMPRDRGHLPGFSTVQSFVRHRTPLRLTGAYVCDSNHHRADAKRDAHGHYHGWRELHPVFRVEQLAPKGHVLRTWVSGPQYPLSVAEPGSHGQFECP